MAFHEISVALAWLHIFAAIAWMGTAMFLVMVLTPSMIGLSSTSRGELVSSLFPRFVRYVTFFATLTLAAGVLLTYVMFGDNLSNLAPTNPQGLRITIGASISLVAYVIGIGVGVRSARKILRIMAKAQQASQQGPMPELAKLQKRMRLAATAVVGLLTVALVFMVAASRL